ncbi:MAG: outer membrane protein assembly factor BamD [Deltaproteobacteria bacterium]|nr:outer membrane protein assembly factor BamD [Deltaproteobacteria bacterium]
MKSEIKSKSQKSVAGCQVSVINLLFTVCCLLFTVFSGCASTKDMAKNNDPALLYAEGANLYHDGDYNEAINKFKKVMEDYPLTPFAEDAQLLLADAYYASSQYSDAAAYYANFIALHPNHSKAPYALFQKGMSYFRDVVSIDRDQTATQKALLSFNDLIVLYPTSIYVDRAKEMSIFLKKRLAEREFYIGIFYFKDKKYKGALARFAEILKKYSEAGMSDKVLYYIGKSYTELGERDLARETFHTLITKFPDSSFVNDAKDWLSDNQDS